jgi:hypothetical protein
MVVKKSHIIIVFYTGQMIRVCLSLTEVSLLINGFSNDIDYATKSGPAHGHLLRICQMKKSASKIPNF